MQNYLGFYKAMMTWWLFHPIMTIDDAGVITVKLRHPYLTLKPYGQH
jgi:hypothetical protein